MLVIMLLGAISTCLSIVEADGVSDVQQRQSVVTEIEAKIQLPKGARPLSEYVRRYSFQEPVLGTADVIATYVYDGSPGVAVIVDRSQMPRILDGGCDVINVQYSTKTKAFERIWCNGVA